MKENPTKVGIAIVEHEGTFLVGIRPDGKPLAGYAEFPGGKCAPEESPTDCAVRECLEETGLHVQPIRRLRRLAWEYPHATVELHFWHCRPQPDAISAPHFPFRWLPRDELDASRFPEANAEIVSHLRRSNKTS